VVFDLTCVLVCLSLASGGIDTVGLFRVPGTTSTMTKLRSEFNQQGVRCFNKTLDCIRDCAWRTAYVMNLVGAYDVQVAMA
jgi:hypothetical protein